MQLRYDRTMGGSVDINGTKLRVKVLAVTDAACYRAATRVRLRAIASIIGQGRYDTGEMARGFRITSVTKRPSRPTYRITNVAPHFPFQELGTPKEAPGIGFIYPKKPGGFLVFKPKGGTTLVFARKVRGVRAGNFLSNAARQTQERDYAR